MNDHIFLALCHQVGLAFACLKKDLLSPAYEDTKPAILCANMTAASFGGAS